MAARNPSKDKIENQLQQARQNLLDLTMRNRLLNYRPAKARAIRVVDEVPTEIYNILVLKEREMEFLPKQETADVESTSEGEQQSLLEELQEGSSGLTEEELSLLWRMPAPDVKAADRHIDRFLQTNLESAALFKRLFYVSQQAKAVFEEQGYTVLYLALGFLEWTESPDATKTRRAPLILIPVELERQSIAKSFKLKWTTEDIFTNVSLQAKLAEQGIALPELEMPEDKSSIDEYFQDVVNAVKKMRDWRVIADIYLDFFSFTKFVMYKDLDLQAWPEDLSPVDHPLIQAILDPSSSDSSHCGEGFKESEIDEKLRSQDLYHIMDADPSQVAVIEDIKAGFNLVAEGPPGTGKSQTIVNAIAELLASEKSVLFVSEKMAALEVVKSRLDAAGLGDFCLELHSRKANKREVLKELERTITRTPPKEIPLGQKFSQLESLKSELNTYAKALGKPIGAIKYSPFELFSMREVANQHFESVNRPLPRIKIGGAIKCSSEELDSAVAALTDIVQIIPFVQPITNHPWLGCEPGTILPTDEDEVRELIDACKETLTNLGAKVDRLVKLSGIQKPTILEQLPSAINAAKVVAVSKPIDRDVLLNPEWNGPSKDAEALVNKIEDVQERLAAALSKFEDRSLDEDITTLVGEYKVLSAKLFKVFNGRYRYLRQKIASLYRGQPPKDINTIIADLEQLADSLKLRAEVRESKQLGHALFGSHWKSDMSDPQMLKSFSSWAISFRQQLLNKALTERAVDVISDGVSQDAVEKAAEDLVKVQEKFIKKRDTLAARINLDYKAVFNTAQEKISFESFTAKLEVWAAELPKLQRWAQFIALRNICLKTAAKPIVELSMKDLISPEDLVPCFNGNFADELLHGAFAEQSSLSNFVGELHKNKIKQFMQLDSELIISNRQSLAYKLYTNQPRIPGGASPNSEAGILLGEFSRKRGHMPIRKLMSLVGGLVQRIKPCFMMSPLSIAQFLDPRTARFDVIIFDEASQVRPEDALGALIRGNQVVVMGDTRQLPPTSFFDHITEADEDAEEEAVAASLGDIESILHQCKRSFPTKILRWHYRSRHESLIAVSNREFYDNKLLVYPSSIDMAEELGLHFVHLPNAVYDRGRSSVNRMEARAVAEAAVEHYKKHPGRSLGVGTFNIKQQQAILEEIELQLHLNPEMEEYFSSDKEEHFFVKNLETIQGDERDVIFLSIGFGFDGDARLSRNFGPLNNEGGERRLNVLISRARKKCLVFSNFKAGDLALDGTASKGLRALKVFLEYAETRNFVSIEETGQDTDSPFEDSVYEFINSEGFDVRKQVGCAGFRVDLAVIDPEAPGRYLIGIECDGAKYHSSPVARDRDRLRQQILEGLGWRIYRVWSTDWYRNRDETKSNLLSAIANVKKTPQLAMQHESTKPSAKAAERQEDCNSGKVEKTCSTNFKTIVPEYRSCMSLGISTRKELHETAPRKLAEAVISVVAVEAPIHVDEIIRRIRVLWGLKRSGQRIQDAIMKAIAVAIKAGAIELHDEFLWQANNKNVQVRCRLGDPPAKINLICDEEIAEAIKLVLKLQYATAARDLIMQASRLLGFLATSAEISNKIQAVVNDLISKGDLQQASNGMLTLLKG